MSDSNAPTPAPEAAPGAPASDAAAAPTAAPQADGAARKGRRRGGRGNRGGSAKPAAGAAPNPGSAGPAGPAGNRRPAKPAKPQRPVHPVLLQLSTLHPRLFGPRPRPLKLGVFEDLVALHPDAFSPEDLKQALGQHVRSSRYLEAVAQGEARHDLDGNPAGALAPEHVQHAIVEVMRRRLGRDAAAARAWARARFVHAIEASGLAREAFLEKVRTQDAVVLEVLDEAFAELAGQAARREALVRAFRASGQPVEAFAEMYGLDAALVRDALARDTAPTAADAAPPATA